MPVVEEREQEHDRDGSRTGRNQGIGGVGDRRLIESFEHLAGRADPLRHLMPHASRRQKGRRLGIERELVHLVTHLPPDLQHVAESLGGDDADLGALALQHGVGRDRGAVHEARDLVGRQAPLRLHALERFEHREARIAARGRDLHDPGGRAGPAYDDVGEGAADVDADAQVPAHSAARGSSSSSK
ncbi:MAG: hypothetical protein M5U07_18885 [Xanthobacteraceae bacterium]|nr:hypothetical protein [Xanthobacteraceae bacterium]